MDDETLVDMGKAYVAGEEGNSQHILDLCDQWKTNCPHTGTRKKKRTDAEYSRLIGCEQRYISHKRQMQESDRRAQISNRDTIARAKRVLRDNPEAIEQEILDAIESSPRLKKTVKEGRHWTTPRDPNRKEIKTEPRKFIEAKHLSILETELEDHWAFVQDEDWHIDTWTERERATLNHLEFLLDRAKEKIRSERKKALKLQENTNG